MKKSRCMITEQEVRFALYLRSKGFTIKEAIGFVYFESDKPVPNYVAFCRRVRETLNLLKKEQDLEDSIT